MFDTVPRPGLGSDDLRPLLSRLLCPRSTRKIFLLFVFPGPFPSTPRIPVSGHMTVLDEGSEIQTYDLDVTPPEDPQPDYGDTWR